MVGIIGLIVLLTQIIATGWSWLDWNFITSYPSRHPEQAGIRSAMMGTIWAIGLTALFTVPIGVGAAIYLEEYAPRNWLTGLIEINISNLAGVPSIVYGLLGWALFVQLMSLGRVVLAGAMTLSLLVLPIVILASREAIRAVPNEYRLGGVRSGRGPVAGYQGNGSSLGHPGHSHRDYSRPLQGYRRGRPGNRNQRASLPDLRAFVAARSIHGDAHSDIQLDFPPAGGFPESRGGGNHNAADYPAFHERGSSVAQE